MPRTMLAFGVIAVWTSLLVHAAAGAEIRVFTPRAGATVLEAVRSDFQKQTGDTLAITLDSGPNLVARVEKGEVFDVLIAGAPIINAETAKGLLAAETRTSLFRSSLGLIARTGAAKPDVGSVEKLKEALSAAKSIAFLRDVNGVEGVMQRLGLDESLKDALRPQARDIVSDLVARGDVELGITAVTQAYTTPDVELIGRLPPTAQFTIHFVAAVGANSGTAARARALVAYFSSEAAMRVIRSQGLDPD
jgi:molybdate transport system substrate-binding protein